MENQAKSKLIKEEFFQQMKTSLQGAPEDITYIVLAIENPEGERRLKEGIVSMQGSSSDLTFLLSQAFKRAPEIKEVVSEAVDFFKFQNGLNSIMPTKSIFEALFGEALFKK